jgi:hypothetical protein
VSPAKQPVDVSSPPLGAGDVPTAPDFAPAGFAPPMQLTNDLVGAVSNAVCEPQEISLQKNAMRRNQTCFRELRQIA